MSDQLPNRKYVLLSLLGLVAVTVLEVALMHGPPERACRAAVFAATTTEQAEQAMRSPACQARGTETGVVASGR